MEARSELFRNKDERAESREVKKPLEVERALGTWKRALSEISLTEGNSSSFATDDLLGNMRNLEGWSFEEKVISKYHPRVPKRILRELNRRRYQGKVKE